MEFTTNRVISFYPVFLVPTGTLIPRISLTCLSPLNLLFCAGSSPNPMEVLFLTVVHKFMLPRALFFPTAGALEVKVDRFSRETG